MLKFTICLIKQENKILLLNREYPSWMGIWNGVGGKIEPNESARDSALREIEEETGIVLNSIQFKGIVTWFVDGKGADGMYIYFAELPPEYQYETPIKTVEGILDWKNIEWVLHPKNNGIATNIPKCLEKIISNSNCFEYRCFYENEQLIDDKFIEIDKEYEYLTD